MNWNYSFVSDNFIEIIFPDPSSQRTNRPAFCDVDNDDDIDLIVGGYARLFFYRNEGNAFSYDFILEDEYFQNINFNTEYYPVFIDIDSDEDYDFFLGYGSLYSQYDGELSFFENVGTQDSMVLKLAEEEFLGIDLGDECIPAFCDIDNDGDQDMFLGDEIGQIHFYRNDGSPEVYDFTEVPGAYSGVNVVNIASPTFCDIDDDGDFDLFVGERSWGEDDRRGDINYYENVGTPDSAIFELVTQNFVSLDVGKTAPPAFTDIDNDGLIDMFVGDGDGNINYFSNTGAENAPYFTFETETFCDIAANYQSRPTFGDLDNDGDLDLLIGKTGSSIHYYINTGTPENPVMELRNQNFLGINYEWPAPRLIDIDNDADLDLFVGHLWNQVVYWKNEGTPETANFALQDSNFLSTPYEGNFSPICFGDIDNDGDYDLLKERDNIYLDLYRNIGTPEIPNLVLNEEHFLDIELLLYTEPYLEDIDNDGDVDLFVSNSPGGVSFWRNNYFNVVNREPETVNRSFTLMSNYPNPFNASTAISYQLLAVSRVNLTIYDITGREVQSLLIGRQSAGEHSVVWDASYLGTGIYYARLQTGDFRQTMKMLLIK